MRAYVLASFLEEKSAAEAARALHREGMHIEAFAPYPPAEIYEVLPGEANVALWVLLGGLSGVGIALLFQWWCNAFNYALDVGGRPLFSLPVYVPICFECMVLVGSFSGLYAFLFLCRLPKLHHALDRSELFARHTVDRFVLAIWWEHAAPAEKLRERLRELGADALDEVLEP